MMKMLKILVMFGLILISGQTFAKTTKIQFKKGQYCATYQIDTRHQLSIGLNKNQQFLIYLIAGRATPVLKYKNNSLDADYSHSYNKKYDIKLSQWKYDIQNKGNYRIGFDIPHDSHYFAEFEFCAY